MSTDREVTVTIPDKEPFEGKATQKQKQKIWDLGWRDEKRIADLGKKQASAVIDALVANQKATSAPPMIAIGLVLLVIGGIAVTAFSGAKATPVSAFLGICGLACGGLMLVAGLARLTSRRL